nr:AFG1/ZapE family ATPase [Streptomyces venezuelae]
MRGDLVWFGFDALNESATTVPDYLALAERFGTLVLDGVPPPTACTPEGPPAVSRVSPGPPDLPMQRVA